MDSGCERLPDHTVYDSEMLAGNAVILHQLKQDNECHGIMAFRCGEHFHIGHKKPAQGDACKARSIEKQEKKGREGWQRRQNRAGR